MRAEIKIGDEDDGTRYVKLSRVIGVGIAIGFDFDADTDSDPDSAFASRPSPARMKLFVNLVYPVLIDVRVDLSRGDVGMAKHLLDDAQIGAPGQQV